VTLIVSNNAIRKSGYRLEINRHHFIETDTDIWNQICTLTTE